MSNFGGSKVRKDRVDRSFSAMRSFFEVHINPTAWDYRFYRAGLIPPIWPPLAR